MYCKKCGNEITDNVLFCTKCGEKFTAGTNRMAVSDDAGNNANATIIKKRKLMPFVLLFSVLVVGIVVLLVVIYVKSNSPERRLQEQLNLGYKYLTELDYEHAVACFEAAIGIAPKEVQAYQGLIDIYVAQENADGIRGVYELASVNLENDELRLIRDAAAAGVTDIMNVRLADGDYDSARELAYSLASIDAKSAERAVLTVSDYRSGYNITGIENIGDNVDSISDEEVELEPEIVLEPTVTIYQPSDAEVEASYKAAMSIISDIEFWMGDYIQYDWNDDYPRLVTNFTSLNDLNLYFSNFFSYKKIVELDSNFVEYNGNLYCYSGWRGGDISLGDAWISEINRLSDTQIQIVIKQECYDINGDYPVVDGYRDVEFLFIYENGKWVFDEIYSLY